MKRGKVSFPAYLDSNKKEKEISIFELANRIFSDLVILYGVRAIFGNNLFSYQEYNILLGNENSTYDISCRTNRKITLIGEAFNTANSFFKIKMYKTIDTFCLNSKPIYIGKGESSTIKIDTLKQILKHNEVWQGLCRTEKR